MNTLRRNGIVVGVDESALAGQAVRWAAEQAALEGRSLRLVRAVQARTGGEERARERRPARDVHVAASAQRGAAHAGPRAGASGGAGRRDRGAARGHRPRGRCCWTSRRRRTWWCSAPAGVARRLSHLLGSVGLSVVRHAACPVVVHRPGHPGRVRDGVVVAVDATADSVQVLEFAFRQASLRRLPIRVLHYALDPRPALLGAPDRRRTPGSASGTTWPWPRRWPDWASGTPTSTSSVRTAPGAPEQDVARAASRADLLVVGTHQRGVLGRLVGGSVSTAILEHATCPVAVVPVRSS